LTETTHKTIVNVKKPLYATVGVGDVAVAAVADVVGKVCERAQTTRTDVSGRVEEARERFAARTTGARERVETLSKRVTGLGSELPEWAELREKFTVEELRKVAEEYRTGAVDRYADLAERGEETLDRVSERARSVGERAAKLAGRGTGRVEEEAPVTTGEATPVDAKKAPATKAPAKKAPTKTMTS
jgi:heparin binding hemagglutinin HbhA